MELHNFLNTSYTAYHATENVCNYLTEQRFVRLKLGEQWNLKRGGKYFVTRNDSSVIAFKIGERNELSIAESHTDSPCFKLKGGKVLDCRLNTEKYGGGLLYTFFDRPLKIAGRIFAETENGVESKLVTSKYNVVIPSVAIHQNLAANDGFRINPQTDTLPLFSTSETDVYKTLTDGKVLDADLYVVPATEVFLSGVNDEFICSARLDNLTSVYTGVTALVKAKSSGIAVAACLDNEETGSGTRQGAPSFLEEVVNAIFDGLGLSLRERASAKENGMILSVDNGHAKHPAHPEKSDPDRYAVMGGGVAVKHHTNYATDGMSAAILKKIMLTNGVKYQDLYNRSDARCGSTLGLVTSKQLGMKVCDIGIAQLAMHSACETCAQSDVYEMQKCIEAFLQAKISGEDKIVIE